MALITGGNVLMVAMATIIFMVIVVGVVSVSVLDLDNQLSVSFADMVNQDKGAVLEEIEEDSLTKELDSEEARELLGFIEYPVVNVQTGETSIFSPLATMSFLRLSEEKIVERCAHVTIPFNNARCLRAERGCATVLESSSEHWECLHEYAFYIGKKL